MRKIYALTLAMMSYLFSTAQVALPLDFESTSITYTWNDFDGGAATVIDNPQKSGINTSNKAVRMVKSAGQVWGGSWIGLSNPIDFTTNKLFKMKVYSPRVGATVLLKVENQTNAGIFFEKTATTTVANTWEELTFDYSTVPTSNQYQHIVLIFDNGTMGDGSANFTFLLDDIRLISSGGPVLSTPTLPIDFESSSVNWAFTDFDGGAVTKIANPQSGGINTSSTVGKMIKNAGQTWAGSFISLASPIDFSTNKVFKMKVFSPRIGAKVLLKVENLNDGGIFFQKEVATTLANSWEDMTFDCSAINTSNQYQKVVLIFDNGTMGDGSANFTFLFDDIMLTAGSGSSLTQMNLPVTFDLTTVDYGLIGFGGAEASTIVVDPTNASNKVAKVIKAATAETWAGTTVTAASGLGFSSKIPFTVSAQKMSVRVWSPDAGIKVRLKVEDHADPTKSVETEATTTVANGWQLMEFNFANQASGTSAINLAYNYDKASIFFNFGTSGATAGEKTYYFDDVTFGSTQLPVTTLSFSATKKQQTVELNWMTATEINNKGFYVQHSTNGQDWNDLAFVKGAGNSVTQKKYTTTDAVPLAGTNYYRLKQVDLDGTTQYSAIVAVEMTTNQLGLSLYPNPAKSKLNVYTNAFVGEGKYSIFNAQGKMVLNGKISNAQSVTSLDVSNLSAGLYFITVSSKNVSATSRFSIQ